MKLKDSMSGKVRLEVGKMSEGSCCDGAEGHQCQRGEDCLLGLEEHFVWLKRQNLPVTRPRCELTGINDGNNASSEPGNSQKA